MSRPLPDLVEARRVHPASIALHIFGSPFIAVAVGWLLLPDAILPIGKSAALAGMIVFAVCCLVLAFLSWRRLVYGFDTDGDFRLHNGLLQQRERRLALSRLQSVEVVAPFLARTVGLASVRIELAGETAVVEFLPRAQAQLGVAVTPDLLITRRGRLTRRTAAVAHAHVQSVRVVQGPWQRALGLASVRADIVPGDAHVVALHREAAQARRIADTEAASARRAGAAPAPRRRPAGSEEVMP